MSSSCRPDTGTQVIIKKYEFHTISRFSISTRVNITVYQHGKECYFFYNPILGAFKNYVC